MNMRRTAVGIAVVAALLNDAATAPVDARDLMIVDCALPGQIRQLGQRITYLSARRPVQTTARDCRNRGGEYVVEDLANVGASLKFWLDSARAGDPEAMTVVGEIHDQGVGGTPDPATAAAWYRRAADKGYARAQVNLGHLYELGRGVERDATAAVYWYRRAAGVDAGVDLDSRTSGDAVTEVDHLSPPEITLIEPQLGTRGLVKVQGIPRVKAEQIIGRVAAPSGLLSLLVDGRETEPNAAGVFRVPLDASRQDRRMRITAIDNNGKRADVEFLLVHGDDGPPPDIAVDPLPILRSEFGRYHALLIANEAYLHLPSLSTPATDVEALEDVLEQGYGFSTVVLRDASRYQILSALNDLRTNLTSADNLLIYYAGHGELDEANSRGHWLPVDAEPGNTANWLSNVAITDMLNVIPAKQIMLIADSCYSGTLTRSSIARPDTGMTPDERITWLRLMASKRARLVLSSGGVAPVLDGGGGAHSVFARALIGALTDNDQILTGRSLHQAVAARVAHAAADYDFEQMPEFAPINRAGHEAGDFFLVPGAR